jgi:hypothetical protein
VLDVSIANYFVSDILPFLKKWKDSNSITNEMKLEINDLLLALEASDVYTFDSNYRLANASFANRNFNTAQQYHCQLSIYKRL